MKGVIGRPKAYTCVTKWSKKGEGKDRKIVKS